MAAAGLKPGPDQLTPVDDPYGVVTRRRASSAPSDGAASGKLLGRSRTIMTEDGVPVEHVDRWRRQLLQMVPDRYLS